MYATGTSGTIGRHLSLAVAPLKIDLRKIEQVKSLPTFSKEDKLIHLAGVIGPKLVEGNYEEAYRVNVEGTLNLATRFLENGGERFIYVSSSHVYAKSHSKLDENSPIGPINSYAVQKLQTENLLGTLFKHNPTALCVVRVFSVLDWGVPPYTLGGAIGKLADPESDYILKFASDVRDFLAPKQIARMLEKISNATSLSGVVNLCSGLGLTVFEAARAMLAAQGLDVPLNRIHHTSSDTPFIVGDNSKLIGALPGVNLKWVPSRCA
jgi:nucleoside-diphosphate-sugar epimerase